MTEFVIYIEGPKPDLSPAGGGKEKNAHEGWVGVTTACSSSSIEAGAFKTSFMMLEYAQKLEQANLFELVSEANFDWQANGANLRGKAWKRTSQVNIWANIATETQQMQCLLIEHIMKIMMLTGAMLIGMLTGAICYDEIHIKANN